MVARSRPLLAAPLGLLLRRWLVVARAVAGALGRRGGSTRSAAATRAPATRGQRRGSSAGPQKARPGAAELWRGITGGWGPDHRTPGHVGAIILTPGCARLDQRAQLRFKAFSRRSAMADYKCVDREQEHSSILLDHLAKGKLLLPMGSMIVPMEPIDHLGGNGDPPSSHRESRHRRPKFLNMAAVPLIKKTMAEFLGTFILMFTQVSAIIMGEKHGGEGLMGIALSVGLAVMVLVFSLIHISGCHMNPAVSIAMAVYGHLPPAHIVPYIAAQVLGSTAASFVGNAIYHPGSLKIGTVPSVGTVEAFAVEFILTFVLLFVITAVATDPHAVKELIAVAVGGTVVMNILIAGPATGASMNPARTIGPAIVTGRYTKIWVYLVATPLGAIAGAGSYVAIKLS